MYTASCRECTGVFDASYDDETRRGGCPACRSLARWHEACELGVTCQQCESDMRDYAEDPNRGGERPEAFCSWRCARGNMREHDELEELGGAPCTCSTCVITRVHEAKS